MRAPVEESAADGQLDGRGPDLSARTTVNAPPPRRRRSPPCSLPARERCRWASDRPSPAIRYPPGARVPLEGSTAAALGTAAEGFRPSVVLRQVAADARSRRNDAAAAAQSGATRPAPPPPLRTAAGGSSVASFLSFVRSSLTGAAPPPAAAPPPPAPGTATSSLPAPAEEHDGAAMEAVVLRYRELSRQWAVWRAEGRPAAETEQDERDDESLDTAAATATERERAHTRREVGSGPSVVTAPTPLRPAAPSVAVPPQRWWGARWLQRVADRLDAASPVRRASDSMRSVSRVSVAFAQPPLSTVDPPAQTSSVDGRSNDDNDEAISAAVLLPLASFTTGEDAEGIVESAGTAVALPGYHLGQLHSHHGRQLSNGAAAAMCESAALDEERDSAEPFRNYRSSSDEDDSASSCSSAARYLAPAPANAAGCEESGREGSADGRRAPRVSSWRRLVPRCFLGGQQRESSTLRSARASATADRVAAGRQRRCSTRRVACTAGLRGASVAPSQHWQRALQHCLRSRGLTAWERPLVVASTGASPLTSTAALAQERSAQDSSASSLVFGAREGAIAAEESASASQNSPPVLSRSALRDARAVDGADEAVAKLAESLLSLSSVASAPAARDAQTGNRPGAPSAPRVVSLATTESAGWRRRRVAPAAVPGESVTSGHLFARHQWSSREWAAGGMAHPLPHTAQQERLLERMYAAYLTGGAAGGDDDATRGSAVHAAATVNRSLVGASIHGPRADAVRQAYDTVMATVLTGEVQRAVDARLEEIRGAASRAAHEWALRALLPSVLDRHVNGAEVVFRGVRQHIQSGRAVCLRALCLDGEDERLLSRIAAARTDQTIALRFDQPSALSALGAAASAAARAVSYSPMTFAQLATLLPRTWLDDQVVNNYLQLLCESAAHAAGGAEVVASLGTHFYAKVALELRQLRGPPAAGAGAGAAPLPALPAGHALLRWLRRRTHLLLPYSARPTATTTTVRAVLVPVNVLGQHWVLAVWRKDVNAWCYYDSLHRDANAPQAHAVAVLRELDYVMRESRRHLLGGGQDAGDAPEGSRTRYIVALPLDTAGRLLPPRAAAGSQTDGPLSPLDVCSAGDALSALRQSALDVDARTRLLPKRTRDALEADWPGATPEDVGDADRLAAHGRTPAVRAAWTMGRAAQRRRIAPAGAVEVEERTDEDDHPAGRLEGHEVFWFTPGSHMVPQQRNGDDCGVFVCQVARCVADGVAVCFTAAEAPRVRQVMLMELWERRLLRRLPGPLSSSSSSLSSSWMDSWQA